MRERFPKFCSAAINNNKRRDINNNAFYNGARRLREAKREDRGWCMKEGQTPRGTYVFAYVQRVILLHRLKFAPQSSATKFSSLTTIRVTRYCNTSFYYFFFKLALYNWRFECYT